MEIQINRYVKGGENEKINIGETKGIIRRLDTLGRVVFPKEFRKSLDIKNNDELEIFLLKDGFYVKKVK